MYKTVKLEWDLLPKLMEYEEGVKGGSGVVLEGVGRNCYLSRWRMRKAKVSLLAWGS